MKSLLVLIAIVATVSASYGLYSPYYHPYGYYHPLPGCRNVEGKLVPCARRKRDTESALTPASTALPKDAHSIYPYAPYSPFYPYAYGYPIVAYTSKCKNNYGLPVPCRAKRDSEPGYPFAYPYLPYIYGYPAHYPLKYVTGCVNSYGTPVPCA